MAKRAKKKNRLHSRRLAKKKRKMTNHNKRAGRKRK